MQKGVRKFIEEQVKLARKISTKDDFEKIELVAGVDQTFIDNNRKVISAVVLFDNKTKQLLERTDSFLREDHKGGSGQRKSIQ